MSRELCWVRKTKAKSYILYGAHYIWNDQILEMEDKQINGYEG